MPSSALGVVVPTSLCPGVWGFILPTHCRRDTDNSGNSQRRVVGPPEPGNLKECLVNLRLLNLGENVGCVFRYKEGWRN